MALFMIGEVQGGREEARGAVYTFVAEEGTQQGGGSKYLIRASRLVLIGVQVKTMQGEDIGTVEDLLVDTTTGEIEYVVVSANGLPDGQLVAVPVEAFKVDANNRVLALDMNADILRNAPSFTKDEWPDVSDGRWIRTVDHYYETESGQREAG
jgi:sporulation protein YlmC with PRC-barrel domain